MNKRSTKFYRKNEAEIMKRLGLYPTRNSGSGWIEKCDGQNELFICELKSTDKESYTLKQKTLQELEYHACVAHKTPVFALQFLNRDEIWVAITEEEFKEYMKYKQEQKLKEIEEKEVVFDLDDLDIDKGEENRYNIYMPSRKAGRSYLARQAYIEQKAKERKESEQKFKECMKQRNRERRKQVGKEIQTKGHCNL